MKLEPVHRATLAACLLITASAASFGERDLLASLVASPDAAATATWTLMAGLLLGGLASDRFGPRIAVAASVICFAVGSQLASQLGFDLLVVGGGIALAVGNGLVEHVAKDNAGRWLNFTHAFYRGGTLVLGLLLVPADWAIWLALTVAVLAVPVVPGQARRGVPAELRQAYRHVNTPWLLLGVLVLIFLAGATELWAAREVAITLQAKYPGIGLYMAGVMLFGRLAASSRFFSGRRQLLTCSLVAATGLGLFNQVTGDLQFLIAITVGFFSASIFPAVLGLLALRSPTGLATILAVGQCTTMLAAPFAAQASGYAFWPAILLSLVFLFGPGAEKLRQRIR